MNVSFYENALKPKDTQPADLNDLLEGIKSGRWEDIVLHLRSLAGSAKYEETKKVMPGFTPSGMFPNRRAKKELETVSGIYSIDIDKKANPETDIAEARKIVEADPYVHSCFSSIGGAGIVINYAVNTEHYYENGSLKSEKEIEAIQLGYYKALEEHCLTSYGLIADAACKDVSRLRYVSYDPSLYFNPEPLLWEALKLPEKKAVGRPKREREPQTLTDFSDVLLARAERMIEQAYEGDKHTALRDAAHLCGGYIASGVLDRGKTYDTLLSAIARKPNVKDLEKAKNTIETGFSEGGEKPLFPPYINKRIIYYNGPGITPDLVAAYVATEEGLNADLLLPLVEQVLEENSGVFWLSRLNEAKGTTSIQIESTKLTRWLNKEGFRATKAKGAKEVEFIKINKNIIKRVDNSDIRKYVRDYLTSLPAKIGELFREDILAALNNNIKHLFSTEILDSVEWFSGTFMRHTLEEAYFYFKNEWLAVSANSIERFPYEELPLFVWDTQIIQHNAPIKTDLISDFAKFMHNVSGSEERLKALRRALGYLLHSYKDIANSKAVILMDEIGSFGRSEGGTGKGLIMQSIRELVPVAELKGAQFVTDYQFKYETIQQDTRVAFIDEYDAARTDFKDLFSEITEEMRINKKFEQSFNIPAKDSPKFVISTNQVITGVGSSYERRKIEIALKPHYSHNFTPLDEFKKRFFIEWSEEDYNSFLWLALGWVQEFLKEGLLKINTEGMTERQLAQDAGVNAEEFLEHVQYLKKESGRIWLHLTYEKFLEVSGADKRWMTTNKFSKLLVKAGFSRHKNEAREPAEFHRKTYFLAPSVTLAPSEGASNPELEKF